LLAGYGNEVPAEIAGEPAGLQFQFARSALRGEEGAFVDARGVAKL
jgi:hypothetical protein